MFFSQCLYCKNFIHDKKFTCKAFPKGIPDKIIFNRIKHDHKIEGQEGDYIFKEE